jgi:SAM-dependent methyltransferase
MKYSPTRGYGLMERSLARHRARVVDGLIPPGRRGGRILDIGCGAYPFFLINTDFEEKHGLEKLHGGIEGANAAIREFDLEKESVLPYTDGYFDVVAMLAVIEHIEPRRLPGLLREIRRVLRPGGVYVLTTPARWGDTLLRLMAKARLVSAEEIEEHKAVYTHSIIRGLLEGAGFDRGGMSFGSFELGLNLWARAEK